MGQYVGNIVNSSDPVKTAYDNTVNCLQNNGANDPITKAQQFAKMLPDPLDQWINTLSMNVWKLMLIDSQQYLNTVWTSNVVPEYNSTIINRFPIFKEAQSDISIKDFNHFFGAGGTMESFFISIY